MSLDLSSKFSTTFSKLFKHSSRLFERGVGRRVTRRKASAYTHSTTQKDGDISASRVGFELTTPVIERSWPTNYTSLPMWLALVLTLWHHYVVSWGVTMTNVCVAWGMKTQWVGIWMDRRKKIMKPQVRIARVGSNITFGISKIRNWNSSDCLWW
jgi:hypothetical protein